MKRTAIILGVIVLMLGSNVLAFDTMEQIIGQKAPPAITSMEQVAGPGNVKVLTSMEQAVGYPDPYRNQPAKVAPLPAGDPLIEVFAIVPATPQTDWLEWATGIGRKAK
jgi:hypothetical protein